MRAFDASCDLACRTALGRERPFGSGTQMAGQGGKLTFESTLDG